MAKKLPILPQKAKIPAGKGFLPQTPPTALLGRPRTTTTHPGFTSIQRAIQRKKA